MSKIKGEKKGKAPKKKGQVKGNEKIIIRRMDPEQLPHDPEDLSGFALTREAEEQIKERREQRREDAKNLKRALGIEEE
ncbi:MAG: hypothetical protein KKH04_19100 [Proteobacteria bacterium]|nr:hypothetical protein [Pseudomonadota bacterium]